MSCCGPFIFSPIWLAILLLPLVKLGCWGLSSGVGATTLEPRKAPGEPWENLQRQKRNWVWNQFFVLEEYTGTDPLYVGKSWRSCASVRERRVTSFESELSHQHLPAWL
ncbi:hypothetical protein AOLI_G00258460 [Acnodon oligacanthus]